MADGEFRIAGAYVEVNLRDNTAGDEQQIRAKLESEKPVTLGSALANPENIEAVKRRIADSPPAKMPVKADDPIDAAWQAKIRASIAAISKDALKIPMVPETAKYREELKLALGEIQSATKQKIPVDMDGADQFKLHVEELAKQVSEEVKAKIKVEVDKDSVDTATKSVDDAAGKMASSAQTKLSPMLWASTFAGLPAAAAVGAAGVGAAFSAVPGIFIGIAAAALKSNANVEASFGGLKDQVVTDTQGMASVLVGPLTGAATQLGAAFTRLKPQIQTAMVDSIPAVQQLTGSVTDFAESAMPGLVTAVRSSAPPLEGLRVLAGQAGAGVTDMFNNMASGSSAAGTSMGTLGGVVRDAEGFIGSLLAVLANGSTGILPQFRATLGQLEGTVLSIASNAMPALQGASSGFLSTISGGLGIISAAAGALGSWTQPLGQLGGGLFATNSAAKLFGTSLGDTGFGLKAFSASVDEAGNRTTPFKTAVSGAEGVMGKMKAGASSLLSAGINPLGIALVGGGLLLDAFGQSQQKAAEAASAHRENVRTLTDAIRQDNGVMAENVQTVNAKALTDKNAAANLQTFGQSIGTATAAINGNGYAYDALKYSAEATLVTIAQSAGASTDQAQAFGHLAATSLETGKAYDQLKTEGEALLTTSTSTGDATIILSQAQRDQVTATINATGAVGEQLRAQRDAYNAYLASEGALAGLTAAQIAQRDATEKATEALFAQQNAQLGYRGAVQTTDAALDTYTKTSQNSKSTEDQKAKALLDVEKAFSAQEQAANLAAQANSNATTAAGKQADGSRAQLQELVKLADGFQGKLPQSVQATISRMSVADATAAGLTVTIDKTGAAVYRLPDGKEIRIAADTGQADAALANVQQQLNALHDKNVMITVSQRGTANAVSQTGRPTYNAMGNLLKPSGVAAFAGGGMANLTPMAGGAATMVPPDTWRVVGDNMRVPEAYIPVDPGSRRSQDLLAETNALMGRGTSAGTTITNHVTINGADTPTPQLASAVGAELSWRLRAM